MSAAPRASSRPATPRPGEITRFAAAVPVGRANAQTAAQLCVALGYVNAAGEPTENHKRRIRLLAEHAVDQGVALVCGDDKGYFTPATPEETAPMEGRFESQVSRMTRRLRAVRRLKDRLFHPQQGRLW